MPAGGAGEPTLEFRDPPTKARGIAPTAAPSVSWPDFDRRAPKKRFLPSARLPTKQQVGLAGPVAKGRAAGSGPPSNTIPAIRNVGAETAVRSPLVNVFKKKLPHPRPGQPVTFTAGTSDDVDGQVVSLEWVITRTDDGVVSSFPASGPSVTVGTEPSTGAVSARLTVTDNDGNRAIASQRVEVVANKPPVLTLDRFKKHIAVKPVSAAVAGGVLPQYDAVAVSGKTSALQALAAALPVEQGYPTMLFANGRDGDGQVVDYAYDVRGASGDFEEVLGTTDEYRFIPDFTGGTAPDGQPLKNGKTYDTVIRVRATDDEGATTVAEIPLTVALPCANKTDMKLTKEVTVWTVNGCLTKPEDVRDESGATTRVMKLVNGTVSINGLELSARNATIETDTEGVLITSPEASVSAVDAGGSRLTLLQGPVKWGIENDGTFLDLPQYKIKPPSFEGVKIGGLPVEGTDGPPKITGGAFGVRLLVGTPAAYSPTKAKNGTPTEATLFKALTPGTTGTARAAGPVPAFSFGKQDLLIGDVLFEDAYISYDGDDTWKIGGKTTFSGVTITVDASIIDGDFGRLHANADFGKLGKTIGSVTVFLIDFELQKADPKPTTCVPHIGKEFVDNQKHRDMFMSFGMSKASVDKSIPDLEIDYKVPDFQLCGRVVIAYGSFAGGSLVKGDISLGYRTYPDGTSVFGVKGDLTLLSVPVKILFEAYGDGYLKLNAEAKFKFLGGDISATGGIALEARTSGNEAGEYNARIYADVNIKPVDVRASGTILASSRGIGACLGIDTFLGEWDPGAAYTYADKDLDVYFSGCDLGAVRETIKKGGNVTVKEIPPPGSAGAKARAALRAREVGEPVGPGETIPYTVDRAPTGMVVGVTGAGALAHFTVIDPTGKRYEATAVDDTAQNRIYRADDPFFVAKNVAKLTTNVIIKGTRPVPGLAPLAPPGVWKVEMAADSVPASAIVWSEGVQKPRATARLTRAGDGRIALAVKAGDTRPGIVARVMDTGVSGSQRLGSLALDAGKVATKRMAYESPALSRGEKRQLQVFFERNGLPVGSANLGTYTAPRPPAPPKVADVAVKRGGERIQVTWKRQPRATSYLVRLQFDDGRVLSYATEKNGIRETVSLRRSDRVKVTVVPVSAKGRQGAPASEVLARRAKPRRVVVSPATRRAFGKLAR